jgi:hypothetical protein
MAALLDIAPADLEALRSAKAFLEQPSLAARFSNLIGAPIERAMALLPAGWSQTVGDATRKALAAALRAALFTVGDADGSRSPAELTHKLVAAAAGAGGGALGLVGLPIELPLSTVVMLRSVAEIARSHGEDLNDAEAKLACLEAFALGSGSSGSDDAAETGYFAIRSALAKAVADAAEYVAAKGIADEAAPALVRLIGRIAARFGVPVSQKVAAQMIPVIGAATGATVNWLFIEHYQRVARGHFTVRRLERRYGSERVQAAYETL